MAKAISDEELQLKKRARRRLVGAIALVLLIVVFLPMILDSEPRPLNQDIAITIPPIPKPESTSQVPAYSISDTAQFGDMTRGPRIVGSETKAEMKRILDEIQTGQFAKEWILENKANRPSFNALAKRDNDHLIEVVGRELRGMMSWMRKPATATTQTEVPVQQSVQSKIEL